MTDPGRATAALCARAFNDAAQEGRLAARTGDVEGAIRAYNHFLALRPNPAPRLRADMERVRAARTQLEATRSR